MPTIGCQSVWLWNCIYLVSLVLDLLIREYILFDLISIFWSANWISSSDVCLSYLATYFSHCVEDTQLLCWFCFLNLHCMKIWLYGCEKWCSDLRKLYKVGMLNGWAKGGLNFDKELVIEFWCTFIQISTPNIFVIKYVHVCDVNLATITGLYYT
jgi:hypothetical protein